ncbi:MAG: rhomboid family intramembrane serine protease [Anaerolineae bacterium]
MTTFVSEPGPTRAQGAISGRLLRSRPRFTYGLLVAIGVAFVIQLLAGGSTSTRALVTVGAQVNSLVASGKVWRLLTAMFLHIGLQHIAFNAWALFSLGCDVEAFYGSIRFVILYFISGLAGNVVYYLLGPDILSAGASGAVFGMVGSQAAFFLLNRELFGSFSHERLANLAVLIGINLVFGFTVPGINNLAHLGGLISGFLLGLALTPRYRVVRVVFEGTPEHPEPTVTRAVFDRRSRPLSILAVAVAVALLVGGVRLGNQRWAGNADVLRQQAAAAYEAGDFATAQRLLEQVIGTGGPDGFDFFNLGLTYLRQDRLGEGISALESALQRLPDEPDVWFALGAAYAQAGRNAEARPLLVRYLSREPTGDRAAMARRILSTLP